MAKQDEILGNIIKSIEGAINGFNDALPGIQQKTFDSLVTMLKDLETDSSGNIRASVNNLKLISKIKSKLESIILNDSYTSALDKYIGGFSQVTKLQNEYFATLAKDFTPSNLLNEIKKQSIDTTLDSLSERGIGASVVNRIGELLNRNTTSGVKYSDMIKSVTDAIINNASGAGLLERYVKPVATDALNQYSATYTHAVASDLGLEWFMYDGVIIDTSRDFCIALVKKKYYHISELADIIRGNFKEFKDIEGKINPKTKLPEGMYAETTVENFNTVRGGHQCNHQVIPVSEAVVPKDIRDAVYRRIGREVGTPAPIKEAKIPAALKNYPVKINPKALIGLTEDVKVQLKKVKGSYYDPTTKTVVISTKERFEKSDWYKQNIVYHETAHAVHNEHGIITYNTVRADFKEMFDSLRSKIVGKEYDIQQALYNKYRNSVRNADEAEMVSAALDTLGSLTSGRYGSGHTSKYYNSYNGKYKEVFAHGAEIYFSKNHYLEEIMPEVHEILKRYMDGIYSNL